MSKNMGKSKNSSLGINTIEDVKNMGGNDVLHHYYEHIEPKIRAKYYSFRAKVTRTISDLFAKDPRDKFYKKNDVYDNYRAETARGIFELVVGDNTSDENRIKLLGDTIFVKMITNAYGNVLIEFSNCAKKYQEEGVVKKSNIITESLELCKKTWESSNVLGVKDLNEMMKNSLIEL